MRKIIPHIKKWLLGSLIICLYPVLTVSAEIYEPDTTLTCQFAGTVYRYAADSCPLDLVLDNGMRISPVDNQYNLQDGERVMFNYESTNLPHPCNWGMLYQITCLTRIPEPECEAIIKIEHGLTTDPLGFSYFISDSSDANVTSRIWEIDGTVIRTNEQSFMHTFSEYGRHIVCLTITTDEGCTSQTCEKIYIGELEPCEADFDYTEIYTPAEDSLYEHINDGYCYEFIDQSFGDVVDRYWTYREMIISIDSLFVHCFPDPGSYEICLNITTSDNCSSSICKTINVPDYDSCKAAFTYSGVWGGDTTHSLNRYYVFEDQSEGQVLTWNWDFDDGTISNEQNPYHVFPGSGVYNICLSIVTAYGCFDTYCSTIIIDTLDNCNADFEYCTYHSTDSANTGELLIGFKNTSNPSAYNFTWSFGDGTNSNEKNPIHRYDIPGIYNVCLTATNAWCFNTICKDVYVVVDTCLVDFNHEIFVPDCDGYEVAHYFDALTHDDVYSHSWDFGDGTSSNDEDVYHIFSSEGIYTVCLTVEYSNGCIAKECKTIANSNIDSIFYDKCGHGVNSLHEDIESLSDVTVYPIPASDEVFIEFISNGNTSVKVALFNMQGQVVYSQIYNSTLNGINQIHIPLHSVENGAYIYKVTSNKKTANGKLGVIK